MKHNQILRIIAAALIFHSPFSILNSSAAVPLRWTVETSRLQPAVFDVVHGESIELEAVLQSYGNPLSMAGKTVSIFWQTNGMDNAWWSAPAFVRTGRAHTPGAATPTNVLAATFTPAMDPGSATVTGFLGATGDIYRAAFTLRFRKGPGAVPNVIEQPPRVLDLAHTVVINPPWPTQADFAATTTVMKAELNEVISNNVSRGYLCTVESAQQKAAAAESAAKAKATEVGYVADEALTTAQSAYQLADDAWTGMDDYLPLEGGEVEYLDISGPLNVTGDEVNLPDATKVNFGLYTLANYLMFGDWNAPATSPNLHFMSKTEVETSYRDKGDIDVYDEPGVPGGPRYQPTGNKLANTNQVRIARDEAIQASKEYSDARFAPTGTAVTVANHTSQISQLSQSVTAASAKADQANIYSSGIYQYMTGNTNAWFSGTNYVTNADATNRTHFAWEPGMDAATVPCSFALWEIRDGQRQQVWDQRDWTVWYWNFKASQMRTEIAATNAAIYSYIDSTNNHAWARRYAASGRINPDRSTTYVDTPKICLSPGMNWETVASVSGCGYWTIVGNGAVIGGSGTNAVLQIKDFEGNEVMTVTKGAHQLVWLDSNDFTGQMTDGNGWVCFDMMADAQPVGYFSTTLEAEDFTAETSANCPAQYRWENLGNGEWRVHFLLKPGIVSDACFAKFQAETQGQTTIRYNAGLVISGGLIYNGVKIVPVIPNNASAGTTITWVVAQ